MIEVLWGIVQEKCFRFAVESRGVAARCVCCRHCSHEFVYQVQ